jgi:hypothetical protein
MPPYVYHATMGEGVVVTLMQKTFEGTAAAHSLCRTGVAPDVDFDRKQWPPARLWGIVLEALGS